MAGQKTYHYDVPAVLVWVSHIIIGLHRVSYSRKETARHLDWNFTHTNWSYISRSYLAYRKKIGIGFFLIFSKLIRVEN